MWVGGRWVLTCAHVIGTEPRTVMVRFSFAGGEPIPATAAQDGWLAEAHGDLALLELHGQVIAERAGAGRAALTGTAVPIEGEARRELERIEQVLRSGKGRHTGCHGPCCGYTPTRDDLVAILRDDATPGLCYQFAAPEDLLSALA